MVANFGGKGSERRLDKHERCRECGKQGVYYLGSAVMHGNPYTPAADTEIDHYYECPHCKREFTVYT